MADPTPEQAVYEALKAACDQNPDVVRKAEIKLTEWESEPGFFPILVQIFQNPQVDTNIRWISAVYFKNGVNKYWKHSYKNAFSRNEKTQIRGLLLTNFSEPIPQVAIQIAVLIARIARIDWPRDWPNLVPQLLEAVRTDDDLQQHRSLLILLHVIKALASKRMIPEKRLFEQLTVNIYEYIYNLWNGYTDLYFENLRSNCPTEVSIHCLEKALLALRILRKLTIYGIYKPHTSDKCMIFLESIFGRLKQCIECRFELKRIHASDNIIELTEKFILKQMKILNEFLEQHPLSFTNFISTSLNFSFNYIFHEGAHMIFDGNVINFRNFAIHCINLLNGILISNVYNTYVQAKCSTEVDIPVALTAKQTFFTEERLMYICEKIITHYFLLTQIELDLWMEDPESFSLDDGGESWKYALRPSIEKFFLTLMSQFRTEMTSLVVVYIRKAQEINLTPETDLKDILLKDAIYNAAGIAAFNLFDEIDFDAWFTNQLIGEIKINADNFRILRRRAIWLIGQWTAVKFSRNLRPLVYEACIHLLQPTEDMSIRLTASKSLRMTLDDFDFEPEPFIQYLEPCFSSLFVLLKETKECDTKMNILSTMSFVVEKMSDHIQKQAEKLITYLPLLWEESEDHNMLRCAIISTLLQIVKALGDIPNNLLHFLYAVIKLSTDVEEPSHIYLIIEGLDLWLSVIENSEKLTPELLELCKHLLPIIEISSENLRTILFIIQAYIILSPQVYLERYGKEIVSTFTYLLNDMRQEGIAMIMKVFETCLRAEPNYGLEIITPALPYIFKQIYNNKDYPMVMGMYLTVIARVLLINQPVFGQAIAELKINNGLEAILDVWITKMPLVTALEKRKLLSLALGLMLENCESPIIQERFPGIMQNICESLNDIMNYDSYDLNLSLSSTSALIDSLPSKKNYHDALAFVDEDQLDSADTIAGVDDEFSSKTLHYERTRKLCLKDPVYRIVITEYLTQQLAIVQAKLGVEIYKNLMLSLDPQTLTNLTDYLNIKIDFQTSV